MCAENGTKLFLILPDFFFFWSSWSIIVLCFWQNWWRCERSSPCLIQRTLQISFVLNIKYSKGSWFAPKCFFNIKKVHSWSLWIKVFSVFIKWFRLSTLTCFVYTFSTWICITDRWMLHFMTWQTSFSLVWCDPCAFVRRKNCCAFVFIEAITALT